MSIHIETAGRPRTPLPKGAAVLVVALTLCGPLAAQTASPLFDDPMEALLEAPQESPQPEAARPLSAVPFEPAPEPRFQNRPAAAPATTAAVPVGAPAAAASGATPAAGLGFSAEPTRIDAQSLGRAGARGDEIVQSAAQRWGLSAATLYMLGALLGLLGLLLLARLLGFGQNPPKPAPKRRKPTRPAPRAAARAPADDWEEEAPEEARFAVAARRATKARPSAPAAVVRSRPAAAPDEDWGEEWAEAPAPAQSARAASARAPAPRRPNLDRLAASIRDTWPKGAEHHDEHPDGASPARAAAARVAREFAAEEPPLAQPARGAGRPSRTAPRGGDFLDALEAAGEAGSGDPSALDRVRALTRAR
ncbi:hypothetical protein [Neomegalonema perideroedes]|uniref:hypothetical protein n=1 Tax=Neomegalonema perideroedes TaxID=217219 RepID=UPI0003A7AE98|nr:hypothetical protein [Neomegalonema perideroedes]